MAQLMTHAPLVGQHDYPILTDESDQPWSYHGRFGRLSYMAWVMIMTLTVVAAMTLLVIIGSLTGVTFQSGAGFGFFLAGTLCLIPFFYFMIVFQVRRLHDLNMSGWWISLPLVNIVLAQVLIAISHSANLGFVLTSISLIINIIFILCLMVAEGSEGANDYGVPRITPSWEKFTGWIYVVLTTIGLIGLTLTAIPTYQNYQKQAAMMHISLQSSYQLPQALIVH